MTTPNTPTAPATRTGSPELNALIDAWKQREAAMTPAERAAWRRETAISWAYGNLTCTGRRPYITREMIEKIYDARNPTTQPETKP